MPSTQARELPCGAWPASPGVLHIPLGAGYSVRFAHRVSAPAEEPARAHRTSTSPRTRSYPLGARRAGAKGDASSTSLTPPPTPGVQTAPEQQQDPWDPPPEWKPLLFRVPATQKSLLKLLESRKGSSPAPPRPRAATPTQGSADPQPPQARQINPRSSSTEYRSLDSSKALGNLEAKTLRDGWSSLQHPQPKTTRKIGRRPKDSVRSWKAKSYH
ncbi:uncharacterized protein LOC131381145 [Hylobates moloch]|uniref:uncharacterized protein LOC131381145 n=1 Tax=Hylobates moloch TaxID=81572 RepID=UPI002674E160|nr:uncharacterized protein LOC131381145 [Hylobates moloch]